MNCLVEFDAEFDGSEDFRSDVPWTYGGGETVSPTCPFGLSIVSYDGLDFTDGVFEADLRIDALCGDDEPGVSGYRGGGVMARLGDNLNCSDLDALFCVVNLRGMEVRMGTSDANCNGEDYEERAADLPTAFEPGQIYTVRVALMGNDARCAVSLDGIEQANIMLPGAAPLMPVGTVGFWAESAELSVTRFRACGL
jgi:hypothetical protein